MVLHEISRTILIPHEHLKVERSRSAKRVHVKRGTKRTNKTTTQRYIVNASINVGSINYEHAWYINGRNSFCNSYSGRYCVSLRFILYNAKVAYVNLIMVHGLSNNRLRSVYLGYIYPMYYMASLLPMLLTFITLWPSMEVIWGL